MFTRKFQAILSPPKGKMKDTKGRSTRAIEFALKTDFTDAIADGLDRDGKSALRGLQKRGISKVEIPFGTVSANIRLTVGSKEIVIKGAHGVKVLGNANMNNEDDAPICEIHFRIPFEKATWLFLGDNFGTTVDARLTNQQTVMDLDDTQAADHPKDDKKKTPKPRPTKGKSKKAAKTKTTTVATVTPINAGKKPA